MVVDANSFEIITAQLRSILKHRKLDGKRNAVLMLAGELDVAPLDCAAALLSLHFEGEVISPPPPQLPITPVETIHLPPIKMQSYRINVGKKHSVDLETLKKILIEESGVDKKNIQNVNIRNDFTLLDLPDDMPTDIFLHLKGIEINGAKFDIRRIKPAQRKSCHARLRRRR